MYHLAVHVASDSLAHFKIRLCSLTGKFARSLYILSTSPSFDYVSWKCDAEHLFMCLLVIYISSFVNYLFKSFTHLKFFSLIWNCKRSLYILSTIHLSDTCVVNIISPIGSLYFHFLMVLFAEQKALILMKFILLIMSLMYLAFGGMSKNSLANFRSWRFSPTFSKKIFIVLNFTIRAIIYFEGFVLYKVWCLCWDIFACVYFNI